MEKKARKIHLKFGISAELSFDFLQFQSVKTNLEVWSGSKKKKKKKKQRESFGVILCVKVFAFSSCTAQVLLSFLTFPEVSGTSDLELAKVCILIVLGSEETNP